MVTQRSFDISSDFDDVSGFLRQCYKPLNRDGNWIQPIWEFSCSHPLTDPESLGDIGIWADESGIVAATIFDTNTNNVSLCTLERFRSLKAEMLRYAEENLASADATGRKRLNVFAHDCDDELSEVLLTAGYRRRPEADRTFSYYEIPLSSPEISLPDGFDFRSLEQENDMRKVHRVLWRGFDHPGEPPEDGIEDRRKMQSSPNFRFDLTTVAKAPSGAYVVYCGMWYDEENAYCYVEPVATDPDYRRCGLGKATVLESLRQCGLLGAEVAYVWTDSPFYRSIGFKPLFRHHCWTKTL